MTVKRSELKRQLLEQARKRPTPRATSTQAPAISGVEATRTIPERFTRFANAPPGLSTARHDAPRRKTARADRPIF